MVVNGQSPIQCQTDKCLPYKYLHHIEQKTCSFPIQCMFGYDALNIVTFAAPKVTQRCFLSAPMPPRRVGLTANPAKPGTQNFCLAKLAFLLQPHNPASFCRFHPRLGADGLKSKKVCWAYCQNQRASVKA